MTTDGRGVPGPRRDHGPAVARDVRPPRPAWWTAQISVDERRELLEQLQVVDVHIQTATSLDSRADACSNAVLAGVLRDRAGQHRRSAERLRAVLAQRGVASCRSARRP